MRASQTASLTLLLALGPILGAAFDIPKYLVIGQQKCGTSTLWALMSNHTQLAHGTMPGGRKEVFFFQHQHDRTYGQFAEHCDRRALRYLSLWPDPQPRHLSGDFTATLISCHCCPEFIRHVNADIKIIAILREPVSRSLSRFVEQYNWPFPADLGFLNKVVQKYKTFEEYAKHDIEIMQECMDEVNTKIPQDARHKSLRDFGVYQCLAASNIVGWSAYSVFLKRWFEFFPPDQFLVLYTSELEQHPKETMRRVEKFLGIEEHEYPEGMLYSKFNTKEKYGWSSSKPTTNASRSAALSMHHRSLSSFKKAGAVKPAGGEKAQRPPKKSSEELKGDTSLVAKFLRPYTQDLKKMVAEGLIPPLPEEMFSEGED